VGTPSFRRSVNGRFFPVLSIVLLILSLPSSVLCIVTAMKMLTPETGWAETGNTLWWTEDGGTHWKNITPDPFVNSERSSNQVLFHDQPEALASISFLDTQTGWVLLCCGKSDPDTGDDLPHYDLAATTDAGATWSISCCPSTVLLPCAACTITCLLPMKDSLASRRPSGMAWI